MKYPFSIYCKPTIMIDMDIPSDKNLKIINR